jgi:hypothetical protein
MSFLFGAWNMKDAKEVWKQESLEDGIQIGEARAADRYVNRIAELERRLRAVGQDPSR